MKYECEMGFQLVGSANRICQSNEQWSGQEPMCESKFQLSIPYTNICVEEFLNLLDHL